MGGNALSVETTRMPAVEYVPFAKKVLASLEGVFPGHRLMEVKSYAGKPDFGDMDILIEGGEGYSPEKAALAVNATEIVRNGDVTSVGVAVENGVFQVDFIKIPPESFDFATRYFALNDLGNLLGRVAHKAGFKLGHLGLLYVVRDDVLKTHVLEEIPVTREWGRAIELFGYSSVEYEKGFAGGFKGIEDVFEFTVSSRYANKDIYLLENRNAKSRIRDRKRKTYNLFLDWLAERPEGSIPAWNWDAGNQRAVFLASAREQFPDFAVRLDDVLARRGQELLAKEKFSGETVTALTGKNGKELGEIMKFFKESFGSKDEMHDWIVASSQEEVDSAIISASKGEIFLRRKTPRP